MTASALRRLEPYSSVMLRARLPGGVRAPAQWPVIDEIGPVGKGPGRYNLMLRGDGCGTRLNKLHRERLPEPQLLDARDALLGRYGAEPADAERFGDFGLCAGLVRPVRDAARDSHA
ncbi:MAG: hypothetical protein LJE61_14590 [Thiocapsa sp.]|nr:hypothetical protein [Thiocapsa sp.]MCG6897351.1 hypothetical protein [Thiocapsa sp.]MCG6986416.1 hypothetical protein [Thiocapsa sp.]